MPHAANDTVGQITPRMTANATLRQYPHTQVVFDRLGVQPKFEGSDCLDEIAWRRGLTVSWLVATLRQGHL